MHRRVQPCPVSFPLPSPSPTHPTLTLPIITSEQAACLGRTARFVNSLRCRRVGLTERGRCTARSWHQQQQRHNAWVAPAHRLHHGPSRGLFVASRSHNPIMVVPQVTHPRAMLVSGSRNGCVKIWR